MKKSEKPASKETSLDDSIQLAIRDEVEKRVEQRENIYWKFGGLFAGVVVLFFIILWRVSISEIRETVEKQLAEKEVVKARDRIMAINSAAEDMNHNLIAISSLMNTNQQQFLERLNQIKQQDNVLTVGDLSNLFISEKITNWANGKLHLSFEPIPGTVKIYLSDNTVEELYIKNEKFAVFDGTTIVFTNESGGPYLTGYSAGTRASLRVQYVRKSLR